MSGVPNNDIKWETTDQQDIALEVGLFNRFNAEIGYFNKNTSGLILLVPIASETGSSRFNSNIGDVSNRGWEIKLGGDIIRSENLRWNSSFNISFVKNNVEKLNGGTVFENGSPGIKEGLPIGTIFGYEVASIAQTQSEIDALNANAGGSYYRSLNAPGDYIFRDINGDGKIDSNDVIPLGNSSPDYFGGWNNIISYKNFDASINFQFVQGVSRHWSFPNNLRFPLHYQNVTTQVFDTWSPENPNANFARLRSRTHSTFPANSKNVVDASYIRLRSASIGYKFNADWLKGIGIEMARLSLSGNNLLTITDYPGIDPESVARPRGGSTIDLTNDDGNSYPLMQTFTLGLNIQF